MKEQVSKRVIEKRARRIMDIIFWTLIVIVICDCGWLCVLGVIVHGR